MRLLGHCIPIKVSKQQSDPSSSATARDCVNPGMSSCLPLCLIRRILRRTIFHSNLQPSIFECHMFLFHLLFTAFGEFARPEEDLVADEGEGSDDYEENYQWD